MWYLITYTDMDRPGEILQHTFSPVDHLDNPGFAFKWEMDANGVSVDKVLEVKEIN